MCKHNEIFITYPPLLLSGCQIIYFCRLLLLIFCPLLSGWLTVGDRRREGQSMLPILSSHNKVWFANEFAKWERLLGRVELSGSDREREWVSGGQQQYGALLTIPLAPSTTTTNQPSIHPSAICLTMTVCSSRRHSNRKQQQDRKECFCGRQRREGNSSLKDRKFYILMKFHFVEDYILLRHIVGVSCPPCLHSQLLGYFYILANPALLLSGRPPHSQGNEWCVIHGINLCKCIIIWLMTVQSICMKRKRGMNGTQLRRGLVMGIYFSYNGEWMVGCVNLYYPSNGASPSFELQNF